MAGNAGVAEAQVAAPSAALAAVPQTGNQKIIEQFLADGIDYMFGNPGTVE